MTDETTKSPSRKTAEVLSAVFSPLLIPTYAMAIALWATILRVIPLSVKLWSLSGVFFLTAVVPTVIILLLMRRGQVKDLDISDRSERFKPFVATLICYLAATWYVWELNAPSWLVAFFVGATLAGIIELLVTIRWKISAHTGSIGGLAGAIFWLASSSIIWGNPLVWISLAVAAVGAVAWARLYLDRHTPMQVLAGALVGALTVYLSLYIS